MTKIDKDETIRDVAEALFAKKPDWVTFYREILGLHGAIRRHYPTLEALAAFEETDTYREVQQMLRKLRERRPLPKDPTDQPREDAESEPKTEPTRVVTVRIPRSLHDALRVEAHEHRTSMNKLCISKLLQFIDTGMVPTEMPARRSRRRRRWRAGREWTCKPGSVPRRAGRSRPPRRWPFL